MDSAPWAAAGGFMSIYGAQKWRLGQRGSTWGVTWHWLMGGACTLGSFDLGSQGDLCIHWVDYL